MLASGIALEAAAFNAIGEEAILYGCKFGVEVEWVDKFPYTITSHPQHIGIGLAWGSFIPLGGLGMQPTVHGWFWMYAFQTIIESFTGQTEHAALKKKAAAKSKKG